MFRIPYGSSALHFGSNGEPKFKLSTKSWITNTLFTVDKVSLKSNELLLAGERSLMLYMPDRHALVAVPMRRAATVKIDLDPSQAPGPQLQFVLDKVFSTSDLNDFLTSYWKPAWREDTTVKLWAKAHPGEPVGTLGGRSVYLVLRGVVEAPRAIKTPDPQYSEAARQGGVEGQSILLLIVNEQGDPELLALQHPAGNGLDFNALETVSHWKFKPALRNGQPVPVLINVEVNFRLY